MTNGDIFVGGGIYGSGVAILLVSLLGVGVGLSLGGPTGYAINPARDLGPRIIHAILPIPNTGTSDWVLVNPRRRATDRRPARWRHLQRSLLNQPKG